MGIGIGENPRVVLKKWGKTRMVDWGGLGLWQSVAEALEKPSIPLSLEGGVIGLGVGGAQGDMHGLGGMLDHPNWGPWKSPSIVKDQVCLSDDGEKSDKG